MNTKACETENVLDISLEDKTILRTYAEKIARCAEHPINDERADLWRRHNDLKDKYPLVLAFPEGAWNELEAGAGFINRCSGDLARQWESSLFKTLYHAQIIQDDAPIEAVFPAPLSLHNSGWGIEAHHATTGQAKGSHGISAVINDIDDLDKILIPTITVDWVESEQIYQLVESVFEGLLKPYRHCPHWMQIEPLDVYIKWRGIENLFMDLMLNPEMVHQAVTKIVDGHISMVKSLERQGALIISNRTGYTGSGGLAYTSELPGPDFDGSHVRTRDLWGSATAQIFSEVSPEMHEEFALAHERRYLELFGLNCYGCCEPLHGKLDRIMRIIPRLRRISISPWADVVKSVQMLEDKYVFSWKPNPSLICSPQCDMDHVRMEMRGFLEKTRGCVTELVMKDTHTIHNQPERISEWVRITREEIDRIM